MSGEVKLNADEIFHIMHRVSQIVLENEEVQKLMNDPLEQFDVVVAEHMFNDIYSGLSAVFNCPYIWSLPFEPSFLTLSLIDEATNPAYTNNVACSYVPPFTFLQRAKMLFLQIVATAANSFHYRNIEKNTYEKIYSPILAKRGRVLPSYEDVRLNSSLILGNTHVSYGTTLRLPQNFKPIGGYHIDPNVKPLPADLKKIVDDAKNGFIYFSMGSNLKSKDFPDEIENNLLKMFGTLKATVIWKFEATFSKLPQNVHIVKWAPQHSILAHPNCLLFITHGGILSTTEAIHFGVPIIGIPVFFDQFNNIDRAVARGFGKRVDLSYNLDVDLKNAIIEVTSNPQYTLKAKQRSFIYHNRPVPPGQELVHWIEHVIATGGAVHLRSPALHVPWYQKIYLDLLATIVLTVYVAKKFVSLQIFRGKRNLEQKWKTS